MASITSAGIGSGLDVERLITQLMQAERQPIVRLELQQTAAEARISAYGQLSSLLDTFRSSLSPLDKSTDFKVFSVTSSDEGVLSASASISAAPGQYDMVVNRIAERHKKSANQAYADKDTTKVGVANDMMTVQVGTDSFIIEFGNKTLEQVRNEINSASDNAGVSASILNTDAGYQLLLTADETGSDSFLQVSYSIDPFALDDSSASGNQTQLSGETYYADSNSTTIGRAGDTMTIDVGGSNFVVDIGAKTLDQIVTDINADVGNTGVTASVESTSDGYRLALNADDGTSALSATYTSSATLSSLFDFQDVNQDRDASGTFDADDLDASFTVDGSAVTRTSNTVDDVIEGLTLDLAAAGSSTVTITRDTATVKERIQAFVEAYNTFQDSYDELMKGDLKGEMTAQSIGGQVRNSLNTAASGLTYSYLSEIGINFVLENQEQEDGTTKKVSRLELDETTLDSALSTSYSDVATLFSDSSEGFGARLDSLLENFLDVDGFIDTRTDGLNDEIDRIQGRIDDFEVRLGLIEERYRDQFMALDQLVATMRSTSDFLTQQLAALPQIGGNK